MTRSPLSAPSARCCFFFSSTSRLVTTALFILSASQLCSAAYYGKIIGKLSELHHGVSGEVYAVDGRTLYIKDLTYDGEGPAAYFYAGSSKNPNGNGFRVRDERGTTDVLKKYRKKDITLTLPEGKTLNNIKWFSLWCDEFAVNFGDVRIPRGFDYPRPQKLAGLNGVHGVNSEPVVVVDAQTLLIPGFSYDGEAPDAKFWVGSGAHPSPQGIRVPDENGKVQPLRRYDRKTIVLTLPGDLTVHQLGHFGVWCEAFTVDFGHVQITQNLNVPPSLKMLGVSPQSKLNCEVLEDSLAFEVRWAVAGDSIVVQLVAKLDAGQYMSFGISATPERSVMVGSDVVVAWVDKQTLQGYAIDYFLDAKSQCAGGRGSCPDTRIQDNTNSVRLLNAAMVNGYSIVTYQRPLKASDELDRQIRTNGSQAIVWAVGPLNERREVSFHSHYLKTDRFIEFSRPPAWNCPMPDGDMQHVNNDNNDKENKQELAPTTRRPQRPPPTPAPVAKKDAWEIPPIQCYEPEDGVFYAQMGPTGGKHGYPAITGHVGWGISWYINGLLIPEINVVRGKKYTFVVEGGENSETPARYHPFYITDDHIGGYQHKTPEEKAKVKIFAGVRRQRGNVNPTGVGRLCNWVPDQNQPPADDFASFGAYQRTLTLECDRGEPGIVEWTPDANTPDTVYYQCFTHRYLGWKINVVDSCDESQSAASDNHEVYVKPPQIHEEQVSDLDSAASIRVPSKVTSAPEFYEHHRHPLPPHHHNHHHHHHHHANNPHPNSQLDQMMRYQLNNQHSNYHHYIASPNKNHPMNLSPNKLMLSLNSPQNNGNPQLTTTRLNSPIGLNYETREPYEIFNQHQSYEEQIVPMRSQLYQSLNKPILMQQNHHNHHYQQQLSNKHHIHHNFPHNYHAGTRNQFNIDTIGHHSPLNNIVRPHHADLRSPLMSASSSHVLPSYYHEADRSGGDETSSISGWSTHQFGSASANMSPSLNADLATDMIPSTNIVEHHETSPEVDQEIHQTATVPIGIISSSSSSSSSSNQPSNNLVTDQRPNMSYGQMKYAFSHPGTSQYVYSRPSQNHHNHHHHHHHHLQGKINNPHKNGQLMIMRRPSGQQLSQRRPIIGTMMMSTGSQDISPPPRPIIMERKKAIYHGPTQKITSIAKQNIPINNSNNNNNNNNNSNKNHQIIKMTKIENKQRAKIESKMSTIDDKISLDRNNINESVIKPARNTGFDPDSIVIEGGFKPIIRKLMRDTSAGRSQEFADVEQHQMMDYPMDEAIGGTNDETEGIKLSGVEENFEPMFLPSPLDRNNVKKQQMRKKFEKVEYLRRKTKFDDLDDMEMQADRLDAYYLPPPGLKSSITGKKLDIDHATSGTLVTYDGKLIEDSSLARSVPRVDDNKRSRGRLNSDILTRTPQFGKFKGQLPPPIPSQVRIENVPREENNRGFPVRDRGISSIGITKLKPLNRNKRSAENHQVEANIHGTNSTDFLRLEDQPMHDHSSHFGQDHDRADHSGHDHSDHSGHDHSDHSGHDHSDHSGHDHTDHSGHDHSDHSGHDHSDHSGHNHESSTGEMLIANIQYIFLTIVLYYAI